MNAETPSLASGAIDKPLMIQLAAVQVFSQYGFRRTSMEDIAKVVGMSRAALYLHYKNKEDILRSLAAQYFEQARGDVRAALAKDGTPEKLLLGAFVAHGGPLIEALMTSPHGAELMDPKTASSGDIASEGEAAIAAEYAKWLNSIGVKKPNELAETIVAAKHGQKAAATDYADYQRRITHLARLFGRGLVR